MHPFICSLSSKHKHFRDFLLDNLPIAKSLIADSKFEQSVKVEIILHQEINIAVVELHVSLVHDGARWPDIEIKCANHVNTTFFVPLESCDSILECIHSGAAMLEFLIRVLDGVVIVSFIVVTNCQP